MQRAVTVNVEAAHHDEQGRIHGHSYLVECWTAAEQDLVAFERTMRDRAALVDHTLLEASIGATSMEALAAWFLQHTEPALSRVIVRRPTLGYAVEIVRDP